jgi:hypothetical protein
LACLLPAAGCDRPQALVICHNANCICPPDPDRDDTLSALHESLELEYKGRPMLDGMEIDIFWHGQQERCLFAHDLDAPRPYTVARTAAEEIARFFERPGEISFSGGAYVVRMELKGHVGSVFDRHTLEQARLHAECALDLYEILYTAALRADRRIVVIFDSFAPRVLNAILGSPRWPGKQPHENITLRLSADFLDSTPSGLALQYLSEFPEVDDVAFHASWITDGTYQAFRSLNVELTIWMFSATVETFAAIEKFEPEAVLTSEAELMRRWLEY